MAFTVLRIWKKNYVFKKLKLPSYIAKNIKNNHKTLKILRNIEKSWEILRDIEKHWEILRHWKHWVVFQYIESQTLNSIQCQCGKLKHWKGTQCRCQCQFFQYFNVKLNVQCQFADPYLTQSKSVKACMHSRLKN